MNKENDIYIGSISPTIGVKEQRDLIEVSREINSMLTKDEFLRIMAIYGEALERIFEENGIKEE